MINWIGVDIQNASPGVPRETSCNVSHKFFIANSCTIFSHIHIINLFLLQHGLFVQIKKTTEKKWEINKSAFTEYTKEETYSGI